MTLQYCIQCGHSIKVEFILEDDIGPASIAKVGGLGFNPQWLPMHFFLQYVSILIYHQLLTTSCLPPVAYHQLLLVTKYEGCGVYSSALTPIKTNLIDHSPAYGHGNPRFGKDPQRDTDLSRQVTYIAQAACLQYGFWRPINLFTNTIMIHFHHLLSTQLLMTAGLTQQQSHTMGIDCPCMDIHVECKMGSCIHPSIHLAMEGGLSLHVTYMQNARCICMAWFLHPSVHPSCNGGWTVLACDIHVECKMHGMVLASIRPSILQWRVDCPCM